MNRRDLILKRALATKKFNVPCEIEAINAKTQPASYSPSNKSTPYQETNFTNNIIMSVESYLSIEPPSYSPITPRNTDKNDMSVESYLSIEPPSYSPITPRNTDKNDMSVESYLSIEPPSYSPITPRITDKNDVSVESYVSLERPYSPQNFDKGIITNEQDLLKNCHVTDPASHDDLKEISQEREESPVRPMSPGTYDALNKILDETDDDDSVKDPDFIIVPESTDISEADSESILIIDSGFNNEQSKHEEIVPVVNEDHAESAFSGEKEITETALTVRPKKGRKRKFEQYTLAERKNRKYANLPYRGRTKEVNAKTFKSYVCYCKRMCHVIVNEQIRKIEFNKFISLGSYESQLLFICSNVTEYPKKRSYVCGPSSSASKPRNFSRIYKIADFVVCREMFLNTFQITTQKVTISLKKQRKGDNLGDHRGRTGGWNKTPQDEMDFVCNIINKIPKYESHYRRSQNGDALYLQPGMSLQKIYDLYVDEYKNKNGDNKKELSLSTFKYIFKNKFNLRFKSLRKDTCNKCDAFSAKLKSLNLPTQEIDALLAEKEKHLKFAEALRSHMNSDITRAQSDETFECLTFDMEKTLPLPRIPTNVVFYKRQLWFYNCGIHVGSTNQGFCFVWVEGEAGRGAQEVGSCLKKFINELMHPNIKHLSLWSDSCGGQNRNIKMVLMLKIILDAHPTLQTIELNFLESGHTFLPNDTDFGKIESHLKYFERLYTANDYINVIKHCTKKTPLVPIKMEKKDFLSTLKVEKNITNRKVLTNKEKVNWLKTKHIKLQKDSLFSIFMKSDITNEYEELYIGRKLKGAVLPISSNLLVPLWPEGKPITQAKLDDLKSMFHLIPEDCLAFYRELKGMEGINDDIEGFGGAVDFEFEEIDM